jgi:hypothetical protein
VGKDPEQNGGRRQRAAAEVPTARGENFTVQSVVLTGIPSDCEFYGLQNVLVLTGSEKSTVQLGKMAESKQRAA